MRRKLRELVWKLAQFRCEYCQISQELEEATFEVDHILATKHRGATIDANLALACFHCNNRKGPNIAGFDPQS